MPAVKLILILRNPIDRAWSRAKMVLREPGDDSLDLGRFSERQIRRALAHPSALARSDYITIINNWSRFFPSEQFYICFYDELSHRPREFLEGVFKFLEVRSNVEWDIFPYRVVPNPTVRTPIPDEYRRLLERHYCPEIEVLYQRFGTPIESWRCS